MNETTTQKIVAEYRMAQGHHNGKEKPLAFRDFAERLSEITPVSHAAIANWESGLSVPSHEFLLILYVHSIDWRRDFAADLLASMIPDWLPTGEIGRRALGYSDSPTPRKAR